MRTFAVWERGGKILKFNEFERLSATVRDTVKATNYIFEQIYSPDELPEDLYYYGSPTSTTHYTDSAATIATYGIQPMYSDNKWVIGGYGIMGASLLLNIFCLGHGVQVKEISSIESLSYLFVPMLSWLFFK